jgi:hypothetical protein
MNTDLTPSIGTVVAAKAKPAAAPATKAPAKKAKAKPAAKKPAAKKSPAQKAAAKRAKRKLPPTVEYTRGVTKGRIKGYKIDADLPVKHNVRRPSSGCIGGALWALFDSMAKGKPASISRATVKASKRLEPYNPNKVTIEFYKWRRFNGVRGRGKKQKTA